MISNYKCRVWHKSHADACERCRGLDYNTSDISSCEAFSEDPDVITIKSPKFVLSNYYPCHVRMYNTSFRSSEHAYQWRFLKRIGMDELAQDVLQALNAAAANETAARIPSSMHNDWHTVKTDAMRDVLHAKADFKQLLKKNIGKRWLHNHRISAWRHFLVFWFEFIYSSYHKIGIFPGANQLGSVMTLVRDELTSKLLHPPKNFVMMT